MLRPRRLLHPSSVSRGIANRSGTQIKLVKSFIKLKLRLQTSSRRWHAVNSLNIKGLDWIMLNIAVNIYETINAMETYNFCVFLSSFYWHGRTAISPLSLRPFLLSPKGGWAAFGNPWKGLKLSVCVLGWTLFSAAAHPSVLNEKKKVFCDKTKKLSTKNWFRPKNASEDLKTLFRHKTSGQQQKFSLFLQRKR